MPETIGLAILTAAGVTDSFIGIGTASALTVAGFSVSISAAATVVGTAAIVGTSIGLEYALNNPNVPRPEAGAQPIKQAVPPRQRGYWLNRISGQYLLFLAAGGDSQDVIAFHSGRIQQAIQLYLHDTPVTLATGTLAHGAYATVNPPFGIAYQNVNLQVFYGTDTQNVCDVSVNATNTSGVWTSAYAAKALACICLNCGKASDPTQFTKIYPQNLPLPSLVAFLAPIWDPRDGAQSVANRDSWQASPNPVLQLMDYLTEPDGGMGEDRGILFPPATLAQWMVEANLCDNNVGGRARYQSAFFYQFDNSPENVINKMLAPCDGWMAEDGEGALVLTVGFYREPTDPPLTGEHIRGFSWRKGQPDEDSVNRLDVSFTNPALGYVTDQINAIRNDVAISAAGIERPKPLDLSSVQDPNQAETLGERAMLRVNPEMSGTFVCTLYAARYLGKRWIKVQFPTVKGLEDCVVEIQDKSSFDVLADTVTLNWNKVDPLALAALDNAPLPILKRADGTAYLREDGSYLVRE